MGVVARRAVSSEAGRWLFGLSVGVYLFSASGSLTTSDAVVTFDVTRSLVERGTVATSGNLLGMEAFRGADGRYYSPFGIGQSVYNIPFYVAGTTFVRVTAVTAGRPDSIPKAFVALGQVFVGAFIIWQIFRLGLVLTMNEQAAALAALTAAFGSVLWPYAKFGFNQPLACATLVACVTSVMIGSRRRMWKPVALGGIWLAASLLTRHEMALAALPIGAWLLMSAPDRATGVRQLAVFAPGVIGGVAAWMTLNVHRFGNPWDAGQVRDATPGFGSSIAHGLAGLLFSPAASLFLYSPVAVAGIAGLVVLWRKDRSTALLLSSIILTFVLFYATLGNWIAGRSWGSRYLVVVVPYLAVGWAVLLDRLPRRWRAFATVMVLAVGMLVQLPGVVVDYAKVSQSAPVTFTTEERQWRWEASSFVMNTRAMLVAVPANVKYVMGYRARPRITTPAGADDRGFSQQFAFSLDFWWLYLFYLGLLTRIMVGVVIALFALWVLVCCQGLGGEIA
jgi:hypothetical protein